VITESDDHLVAAAQAGESGAFGTLVERHRRAVYGLALRMLQDPPAAEDAAQEALVKAYRALGRYEGRGRFRPWLLTLTANLCVDQLRRRRGGEVSLEAAAEESGLEPADAGPGPEQEAERSHMAGLLERAIGKLPVAQRLVVTMVYMNGVSFEEAAEGLGIPIGTAKSHAHRGRAALRRMLSPHLAEVS